jgi:3-dehydroquinate dehydratase type I
LKSTLRIGRVALRPHAPTVIVPVTDRTPLRALKSAARQGVELAEARVDLFREQDERAVTRFVRDVRKLMPVLVTLRSSAEGGAWHDGEPERLALYRALLPVADAVDTELAAPLRADLVTAARRANKLVVLSHHDFEKTPTDAALDRVVTRGFRAGADVVKLAAKVEDDRDTARLAALFARHAGRPLVVIGMGDAGKKTRVLFPALGSLFTFAALGRGTAPGQLDVTAMSRALGEFFPGFAARFGSARRRAR